MNVTAISSLEKRAQDFNTLQTSLQSGNVVAAQGAFAAFLQDVQNVSATAGSQSLFAPGSGATSELAALGSALKSSNLPAARTAFAGLQKALYTAGSTHVISSNKGHRPLSHNDIAANSAVPLQTISPSSLAKSIGSVLNTKV